MSEGSHYDVLQVSPGASLDVIKAAYRARSRTLHPDGEGGQDEMAALNHAFEVLRDSGRRAAYDDSLAAAPERSRSGRGPAGEEPGWGSESGWGDAPSESSQPGGPGDPPGSPGPEDELWGYEDELVDESQDASPPETAEDSRQDSPEGHGPPPGTGGGPNPYPWEPGYCRPPAGMSTTADGSSVRVPVVSAGVKVWATVLSWVMTLWVVVVVVITVLVQVRTASVAEAWASALFWLAGAAMAYVCAEPRMKRRPGMARYVLYIVVMGLIGLTAPGLTVLSLGWLILYVATVETRRRACTLPVW